MKSVDEIIALWKEMGISNLEDYRRNTANRAWFDDNIENFKKFDANIIDCKLFWQAARNEKAKYTNEVVWQVLVNIKKNKIASWMKKNP